MVVCDKETDSCEICARSFGGMSCFKCARGDHQLCVSTFVHFYSDYYSGSFILVVWRR